MIKGIEPTGMRAGTRLWSLPFALAVALLALLCASASAWAHGSLGDGSRIRVMLDEKSKELEGVTIQVVSREEMGNELLVENNSGETLEIFDAEGKPLLRIGPEGVEAKRPEDAEVNRIIGDTDADSEWVHKSDERFWGWFDQRLQVDGMTVPEEIRHAGEPADLAEWSIPVRLGATKTKVRGTFRYEPPPKGNYVARLTSGPKSSEIYVQLAHGYGNSPTALFMQNQSDEPVTILGRSGEPAIRIGPEEVQINTNSPVGREADTSGVSDASAGGAPSGGAGEAPEWKTVSGGSNFVWQDSRLRPPKESEAGDGHREVARWEIPMEVAGEKERLMGVIEWKPFEAGATDESEDQRSTTEIPDLVDWITPRGVASVRAVTVVPVAVMLAVLLIPELVHRRRNR